MPLQFRRGTDTARLSTVFASGEPVWTTDLHQLWVGDGVTPGGLAVGGSTGTSGGGYATTSSLTTVNGLHLTLNTDGSVVFPYNNTLYTTTTLNISVSPTLAQVSSQGLAVVNTQTDSSHSTLFVTQNTNSSVVSPSTSGVNIWAVGADSQDTIVEVDNFGTGANKILARSANGTAAAPTYENTGGVMLRIGAKGYGATTFGSVNSAQIDFVALERFSDSWKGAAINFSTVNTQTTTLNTSMSVSSQGVVVQAAQLSDKGGLFVNLTTTTNAPSTGVYDSILYGINKPNNKGRILVDTFSNTGTGQDSTIDLMSPVITGRRARNTLTSPQAVKNGDALMRINGIGHNGTSFASSASGYIYIRAAENLTPTAAGGKIEFGVLHTGTTNTYVLTTIDQTGITTESINASVDIDAQGDINSQNNLYAANNVTAGKNLTANQNLVVAGTGLVGGQLTAGSIVSNSSVVATTDITAGGTVTGANITATGSVSAGTYVYAGTTVHAGQYVKADTYITATTNIYAGANITGNSITATTSLQAATLNLTGLSSVQTSNALYFNPSTGQVTYGALVNPFNQSLNTTDSPTFVNLNLNGNLQASTWTYAGSVATLDANSLNITTTPDAQHSTVLVNESGTTSHPPAHAAGYAYWAIGANNVNTRIVTDNFGSAATNVWGGRSARGTALTPSATLNGDVLIRYSAYGYGTSGFQQNSNANISFVANENYTDTAGGGKIVVNVLQNGSTSTYTQPLTIDSTGVNITNINSVNEIVFADSTIQTTAWTGTVHITTASVTGLATIAWTGKLSDGTGQISTSTVSGLSKVGYTNNYNDLNNLPSIATSDQALYTTSTVKFQGLTVTTGTAINKSLSIGGIIPLTASGTSTVSASVATYPILVAANFSNSTPIFYMRGFGQNRPGGTSATAGNASLYMESARGTNSSPLAAGSGDTLGGIIAGGYDGANWQIDQNSAAASYFGWYATEGWTSSGTTTLTAGTAPVFLAMPQWTRVVPNGSAGRQHLLYSSWTTSTSAPAILNMNWGSGTAGTAPTQTNADGTTYTGYGRANIGFINSRLQQIGVTGSDPSPDNTTLPGTNTITLVSNRRSGVSGRRNAVQSGDGLGGIQFYGQNTTNGTGIGAGTANIQANALETFTGSAAGSSLVLQTANTGTLVQTNRLYLTDQQNQYSSDLHTFTDKSGLFTAFTANTATLALTAPQLKFADSTVQTTAWTGSVSTSSVTGLSTVGYTNNYNDLNNLPTIPGPISDQALYTTSTVKFQSISITTGSSFNRAISVGGILPLSSTGTSILAANGNNNPVMVVANTVNTTPLIYMRGYGQNRPGGTSTTAGNANMYCEGARGTPANPIAVGNGDTLGGFIGGGYDGANWFIDYNTASPNFFGYYATEGWNYTGTTTTQAGSGILLLAQPQWTRVVPNGTAGRQHIIYSSWTTATNAPAQLNLNLGSGTAGTAPTQTNTDGTTFTGYGRANISLINSRTSIYGVPSSDPAADNITLSGTNYISLISGRRSGASGRRNQIQLGDDLGGIQFFGQTTNSSTGAGVNVGKIQMNALETFTSGAHGTNLFLQTTQIGTGNLTTRIGLSDQVNNYNADSHLFSDKSGTFSALELSTNSNAVFASGVTVGGTGVVYPGDGQIQSYAWQPAYGSFYDTTNQSAANTTNLNLVSIGSATTSSDIVLTGNGAQVSNAGVYNIQMSIQFDNSGNNAQDVVVWLRQNGTDLANSAGVITVPGQHGGIDGKIVSSWNYLVPANANDTFYLYWQPQSTAVTIATTTVGTGTPQAPGVIFTIVRER